MAALDSPPASFEAAERTLEISFREEVPHFDLRSLLSDGDWTELLKQHGNISVLSTKRTELATAYLLSESSLFVWKSRFLLKTCGQATPLRLLSAVLEHLQSKCSNISNGPAISHLRFRHGRMRERDYPHRSVQEELDFLKVIVPAKMRSTTGVGEGGGIVFEACEVPACENAGGVKNGVQGDTPSVVEFVATGLEPDWFSQHATEHLFSAKHGAQNDAKHRQCLDAIYRAGGVLFDNAEQQSAAAIDEFWFTPQGFSSNVLFPDDGGRSYLTIHLAPEPSCSYLSVETNRGKVADGLRQTLQRLFSPKSLEQRVFVDSSVEGAGTTTQKNEKRIYTSTEESGKSTVVSHLSTLSTPDCSTAAASPASGEAVESCSESTSSSPDLDHLPVPRRCLTTTEDIKTVARAAIREFGEDDENSIGLLNLTTVRHQWRVWERAFAGAGCANKGVSAFYAMKCNADPLLLRTLAELGAGFDCASEAEIAQALALGLAPDKIVFASAIKFRRDIRYARNHGVRKMTFDSTAELRKIAEVWAEGRGSSAGGALAGPPPPQLLLRIAVEDSAAQCPLGNKFGADAQFWEDLLTTAHAVLGPGSVSGVSFHVGSGCSTKGAFRQAISDAARLFALNEKLGLHPGFAVLDIGGGFSGDLVGGSAVAAEEDHQTSLGEAGEGAGDPDEKSVGHSFPGMAMEIKESLLEHAAVFAHVTVIAEPGRFFAQACLSLLTRIMGLSLSPDQASQPRYYLSDGVYGSFNNLVYDHAACGVPIPLYAASLGDDGTNPPAAEVSSVLFGPTCDGFDRLCILPLPALTDRDYLIWRDMGAYTIAAASRFNGMRKPTIWYYEGPVRVVE